MLLDATTARLLPEHVDLSVILTMAGLGAFGATCIGAFLQFGAERLRRVALFGSMVGGTLGVGCWVLRCCKRYRERLMIRYVFPYLLVAFLVSAVAGWTVGGGQLSVLGCYGVLTVALGIALFGYVRWDLREHGRPSRRR